MECALRINIYRNTNGVNETNRDTISEVNETKLDTDKSKKSPEQKLLELITESPECSQKEYAIMLEVSVSTIKRLFAKLQTEKVIQREGTNRKGKWIIAGK